MQLTGSLHGVIFDLDGTLCDTIPLCIHAFQTTLELHTGRVYTADEVRALFGPNEEGILQRILPDTWEAGLADYLRIYDAAHAMCPALFPGMTAVLETLLQRGVRLALVTGKGAGSCALTMRTLGLVPYFEIVETGSPQRAVKVERMRAVLARWEMPAAQAAYVGDSPFDMRDARTVGVLALGAGWAESTDLVALRAAAPDAVFSSVAGFAWWIEQHPERD